MNRLFDLRPRWGQTVRLTWRRWLGLSILALPVAAILVMDLLRRADRLAAFRAADRFRYGVAILESAAIWIPLVLLSTGRGAVRWIASTALVLLAALVFGVERYFYDQYATYLNDQAVHFGWTFRASVLEQIRSDGLGLLRADAVPMMLAVAFIALARSIIVVHQAEVRRTATVGTAAFALALIAPWSLRSVQAATPDVIGVGAVGGLLHHMAGSLAPPSLPGLRHPEYVPSLTVRDPADTGGSGANRDSPAAADTGGSGTSHDAPAGAGANGGSDEHRRRNVLLILTESVRFDAVCSAYDPACKLTPFSNRAAPARYPLFQMRAHDSTTAISMGVIWSGLGPTESRQAIHTTPLVFDFARAAGFDAGYWTSQHPMFANAKLFVQDLPVSHRALATDLEPDPDVDNGARDELATERAVHDLTELTEPWLGVVQYANTHFPYRVDDQDAPFQPATTSKFPGDNAKFMNQYRNAIYAQDRTIASLIHAVRAMPSGARTVIVFTSDHGEAFREHDQLGHTVSVYDEELRVPAFIDAPPGLLDDREVAGLVAAARQPTYHADLAPTMLDAMGLWDAPELTRFRARMIGVSLLRADDIGSRAHSAPAFALTNCNELWGCAFRNWGMIRGFRKLEAREWDADWHCWNLADDPLERHDLGLDACSDLVADAHKVYGVIPRDSPPMPEKDD